MLEPSLGTIWISFAGLLRVSHVIIIRMREHKVRSEVLYCASGHWYMVIAIVYNASNLFIKQTVMLQKSRKLEVK